MSAPARGAERLIVVGAGAAGQMAAIAAAERGAAVTLLEQMDRPGLKILASGGGRCNLTNLADADTFTQAFGRQGRFVRPALEAMDPSALREFFQRLGVPTRAESDGRVFPVSQRASDVQQALQKRADELCVRRQHVCKVVKLHIQSGAVAGVHTADGETLTADAVVLATGGRSYPGLGGTGGGYDLARQAGHEIVEPSPALVGLLTRETWPGELAGVSLSAAKVRIALRGQPKAGRCGEVIFTHRGVSGPAVLNLSGDVSRLLTDRPDVPLALAVTDRSHADWRERLARWRSESGRRTLVRLLQDDLPARLARAIAALAGVDAQATAAHISAGQERKLAELLAELPLTAVGTEGFDKAMVTRGGVKLNQVDPNTMQSRLVRGLYFAGELLDLDGPCGGFNLHWAFAGGRLAGLSAGEADATPRRKA